MEKTKNRTYTLDGDTLEVTFRYDELSGKYLGDYPDFVENPRYTPNGRPWVDVTCGDECPHCDAGNDGGACGFFHREKDKDVIAVCFCDALRIEQAELSENSAYA